MGRHFIAGLYFLYPSRLTRNLSFLLSLFLLTMAAGLSAGADRGSSDYGVPREAVSSGGSIGQAGGAYSGNDISGQPATVGESTSTDYTDFHGYLVETSLFPNVIYSANLLEDAHARGIAWTDADNDGDWDIYIARGSGPSQQDYFYINTGTGRFIESSLARIGSESDSGAGVAFADYDGDGDLDGYVQNAASSAFLWRNDGASFTERGIAEGVLPIDARMPSWGDFDADGLVDLVLPSATGATPGLYQNTGNYAIGGNPGFRPNTDALQTTTQGVGAWADLNNDGYLDLYIAQSSAPDLYFRNNGSGRFVDDSAASGIASVTRDSQGVAFGDYDLDGFLDIYVACGGSDSDLLWHNNGDGTFTDTSGAAGISDTSDGRSCLWFDADNNGDMDIYVANAGLQQDLLYVNRGNGTFQRLGTGKFEDSYGCATADYDNDGDMDVLVSGGTAHLTLYKNQSRNRN